MSTNLTGKAINVNHGKKGVVKETVIKHLKSGIIRTKEGSEFHVDDVYNKGRGVFVDLKGGAAKKAPAKETASTPAPTSSRSERPAPPAVTADELEGKKINGVEVKRLLRKSGRVELVDGSTFNLSDVRRKGKGFACDAEPHESEGATSGKTSSKPADKKPAGKKTAETASTKGGVTKKANAKKNEDETDDADHGGNFDGALYGPAGQYETSDVRGKVIDFDGEDKKVVSTYKSGRCVLDDGTEFQIDEVRKTKSGKFAVYSDDYIDELRDLWEQANKKPAKAPKQEDDNSPVTTRDLKKNVTQIVVGKKSQTVSRIFNTGTVELDSGIRFHVSAIKRVGAKLVYEDAAAQQKSGGALPKNREVPPSEKKVIKVSEFDDDTSNDLRDLVEQLVRTGVLKEYDIDVVSVFAGRGTEFCTVAISFAVPGTSQEEIQGFVERQRRENFADDSESDLDQHQLSDDPLEEEEPEEEEEVEEEEPEEEEEVEEEEETEEEETEEEETEEEEEPEEEEELEEEEEPEEEEELEEEEDFSESQTFAPDAETMFPEDATEYVNDATSRMAAIVPTGKYQKAMRAAAEAWYASQDVFTAFGYNVEPGFTVKVEDQDYLLIGLREKNGEMIPGLINVETQMLKTMSYDDFTNVCEENGIEV